MLKTNPGGQQPTEPQQRAQLNPEHPSTDLGPPHLRSATAAAGEANRVLGELIKSNSGSDGGAPVVVAGPDHWFYQVVEAIVSVPSESGETGINVLGGSDNGEFPYLGEISSGVRYQSGGPSLAPGAILLEVQGQRVAGYTQRDVVAWISHCTRNGNPCVIRTAPPGEFCHFTECPS
ncbi:unnamed protein product [Meganyctiphanes norvegica]|uniref:PDZ domain-containing protein n=1 Tax=Meganyctiphanes norvegica TaxID=48144 RepID=A0AAV2PM68_MEGNR